jgi:iron(II)-dependent oxidoreductase
VGVNWFEALAYTRWLTAALTARRLLPAGWRVRLPSEAEWEKAARGGEDIPVAPLVRNRIDANAAPSLRPNPNAARAYPWGDDPDPNRANYTDSGVGATSAVGCFAAGVSPYGCHDLSGNVWEWTRSLWGDDWQKSSYNYPYHPDDGREKLEAPNSTVRVLRGGSFGAALVAVRCAARFRYLPDNRNDGGGFRVLAAPSTSDL